MQKANTTSQRTWWRKLKRRLDLKKMFSLKSHKNFSSSVQSKPTWLVISVELFQQAETCKRISTSSRLSRTDNKNYCTTLISKSSRWRGKLPENKENVPKKRLKNLRRRSKRSLRNWTHNRKSWTYWVPQTNSWWMSTALLSAKLSHKSLGRSLLKSLFKS